LRELAPQVARETVVYHPDNPASAGSVDEQTRVAAAAGITAFPVGVRGGDDLRVLYETITKNRCEAMNIHLSVTKLSQWRELIDWGTKQRLIVSSSAASFATAGPVMTLGNDIPEQMRRLAYFVDRILRGTSPSDLPIEQPTKFQFIINLKTAKALGVTIPPSLLARADQVIE
jgi:putative tryptophan/tyrosine transport system substrate-binding protein